MLKRAGRMILLLLVGVGAVGAPLGQPVVVGAGSALPLPARYFLPAGPGPFPAVVVMHGVGGLWANDNPAGGVMSAHFAEWAQTFADHGYASLFVDSYTPRGLVEFPGRRPAEDPAKDDAVCSPSYERPKDCYKALRFLRDRPEIQPDRVGLLGFSQGAETSLASLLSASVTRADWTMSYLKLDGSTETRAFPGPVRPADELGGGPGFAAAVVYYPGCGFYNYFGSPNSTEANLYMPSVPTLIQHASADPLYSAGLFPEKLVLKSAAQAASSGLPFNPLQIVVYPDAAHSFDEADIRVAPPVETPNQSAKRLARAWTLAWLDAYLKPPRLAIERSPDGAIQLFWTRAAGVRQRLLQSSGPEAPNDLVVDLLPATTEVARPFPIPEGPARQFFRLENRPSPPW